MICPKFSWEYALFGMLGGVAGMLIRHPLYFEFPYLEKVDRGWRLYWGGIKYVIVAGVAGCIGDRNPWNAMVWGLAGWNVLDWLAAITEKKIKALLGGGGKDSDV